MFPGQRNGVTALAFVARAVVLGFLVVIVPGGLGPREWLLQQPLTGELAGTLGTTEAAAVAVGLVLVLRLVWTVAEVMVALVWYLLPEGGISFFHPARNALARSAR